MDARTETEAIKNRTTTERTSDRELVVTRTVNGLARIVFDAWTKPELLQRWWTPKSLGISFVSCEIDARVGGGYRFKFTHPDFPEPVEFFGKYLEVKPHTRLVWSNEEAAEGGQVTTVTLEEKAGQTKIVVHDLYPSKDALDAAIASGSASGMGEEMFEQLDALLASLH